MYSPISLDYFLNMEVAKGGGGKEILNLNGKLKYVKDIIEYWKTTPTPQLTPQNSQYYNCMIAGFRKGVENHHDIGWDNLTKEYYDSLELMSDEEIEDYLLLALNKALEKAHSISETELAAAAKDGMPNIPGMDMFK